MRKICITFIMISILMVSFALPCDADLDEDITLPMEFYGPPEDINHEGHVDYIDVSLFVNHYGGSCTPNHPPGINRWDINKDGLADYLDASRLVNRYGLTWIVL